MIQSNVSTTKLSGTTKFRKMNQYRERHKLFFILQESNLVLGYFCANMIRLSLNDMAYYDKFKIPSKFRVQIVQVELFCIRSQQHNTAKHSHELNGKIHEKHGVE